MRKWIMIVGAVAALGLTACDQNEGPLDEAAEDVEDAADDAADDVEDAADDAGDELDDMTDPN